MRAIVRRLAAHSIDWRTASWLDVLGVVGVAATAGVPSAPGGVTLRPATRADAGHVLEWRNESTAVQWSATGEAVPDTQHARWFAAVLDDPGRRLVIAEVDGEPIGSLRVDVADGVGVVSIAVAPQWRGRGYGRSMLQALEAELAADCQVRTLEAVVHPENEPSRRAFEANGFAEVASERPDGMRVLRRAS